MPRPTGARQFSLMAPPCSASNYTAEAPWEVADNSVTAGPGPCVYKKTKLDLRGFLVSESEGMEFSSIVLQEAGPVGVGGNEEYCLIMDVFSTVEPTEVQIANWYNRPIVPGEGPGFIVSSDAVIQPDIPRLNPSQVCWGLWRQFAVNGSYRLGAEFPTQKFNSGYFGQGEIAVAPEMWWTRVCYQSPDNSGVASNAFIPAANLVIWGIGVDITAPEEMTAMMRAVQR